MNSVLTKTKSKKGEDSVGNNRIVLLLDLDCFYAQCEVIRLGIDPTLPVTHIQWNSALAVNYPARALGIKRGDKFEEIRKKSRECISIHVPVLPMTSIENPGSEIGEADDNDIELSSKEKIIEEYTKEFCQPPEIKAEMLAKEKNVMRKAQEGKASLERYRLASSRIFTIILEALTNNIGKDRYILERASVDELFIDVTQHCYDFTTPIWTDLEVNPAKDKLKFEALEKTIICGKYHSYIDDLERSALNRGCEIAYYVRKEIFEKLGFTLSAGISVNKVLAKLAAPYGKPNGQAVIFSSAVHEIMEETKIRKVRNFGGKVGKKILSLLPEGEETMGSISRLLTLQDLSAAFQSEEMGRFIFNSCRGIDTEPVKESTGSGGALVKSITSCKSFGKVDILTVIDSWLALLATDVVSRVENDLKHNNRYPKVCNLSYSYTDEETLKWMSFSIRVPYPKDTDIGVKRKTAILVDSAATALQAKVKRKIQRISICATSFEQRAKNGGIKAFLSSTPIKKEIMNVVEDDTKTCMKVEDSAKQTFNNVLNLSAVDEHDLQYARKLQAQFDEENRFFSNVENLTQNHKNNVKEGRIENFFVKRKDSQVDGGSKKKRKIESYFSVKKRKK